MIGKIRRETTVRWLVIPSDLRKLADMMEQHWSAAHVGDSTLVEAIWSDADKTMLEIRIDQERMVVSNR